MRRALILLVVLVSLPRSGSAQALPDLKDFVAYSEMDRIPDLGGSSIAVYRSDGTSQLIFSVFIGISGVPNYAAIPAGGVGSYFFQPTDANHGFLSAAPGAQPTVLLTFTGADRATSLTNAAHTTYVRFQNREELVNVSNRTYIAAGKSAMSGFVITGSRPRWVLARVVGPTLKSFGVTAALDDPQIVLYGPNPFGNQIPLNLTLTPKSAVAAVAAFVGAFPLPNESADAVLFVRLSPGVYSVVARSSSNTHEGDVLTEVYILP